MHLPVAVGALAADALGHGSKVCIEVVVDLQAGERVDAEGRLSGFSAVRLPYVAAKLDAFRIMICRGRRAKAADLEPSGLEIDVLGPGAATRRQGGHDADENGEQGAGRRIARDWARRWIVHGSHACLSARMLATRGRMTRSRNTTYTTVKGGNVIP